MLNNISDLEMQIDHLIPTRELDRVVINKERKLAVSWILTF